MTGGLPEVAPQVTVRGLIEDSSLDVGLRVVGGKRGLERLILHPRVQKSGLALAGHSLGIVATPMEVVVPRLLRGISRQTSYDIFRERNHIARY